MNIEKLEKLKQWLLAEPRRYNQTNWILGKQSVAVRYQRPPCGTAACIAGAACLMEGLKPDFGVMDSITIWVTDLENKPYEVPTKAQEILGLTDGQSEQLFAGDLCGWPEAARAHYYSIKPSYTSEQCYRIRAEAACMAIDALIAKGKSEQNEKESNN